MLTKGIKGPQRRHSLSVHVRSDGGDGGDGGDGTVYLICLICPGVLLEKVWRCGHIWGSRTRRDKREGVPGQQNNNHNHGNSTININSTKGQVDGANMDRGHGREVCK